MANKITLDTITSSFASTSLFNTNFAAIKSELDDKVLYRNNPTGEANQMENDLDMNSNDILNASSISTTGLTIDGRDVTPSAGLTVLSYTTEEFTNVAGETVLTCPYTPTLLAVYYNGVLLAADDYTATNGTTITLAEAVTSNSDIITCVVFQDYVIDGSLAIANNLSELPSPATARTNLGMGDVLTDITTIETQQAQGQNYGKNLIINGDFSVWQRDTSQTSSGYGSDDRWLNDNAGSAKTHSRQSFTLGQTDVPNNPKYYSRTVVTSAAGADNFIIKHTSIEGLTSTAGREITLSFWAKADASKNIATEFRQSFGTGGSPSTAVDGIGVTTHALTTTWTKFTTTVTIPSILGKTLGSNNDDKFQLYIWLDAGSDFDARTNSLGQQSGTFDIANVQLEFGDTATEFEYVNPADQEARCKRYFERFSAVSGDQATLGTGFAEGTTQVRGTLTYAHKRSIPSISGSAIAGDFNLRNSTPTNIAASFNNCIDISEDKALLLIIRDSGTHTSGDPFHLGFSSSSSTGYLDIDAEL